MEASALHAPSGLGRITAHGPLLRLRTDDQLVALFRLGYDEAFRAIHDRYRQRLFAYTRQMLGASRSDAEDVLQDVFLRAYGALRHDERPVTLRAWLYRVAHNRCIDHLRRPVPPAAEVYELSRRPILDPPDQTERRECLRQLVQDVQRLPEQQRSALLMRELDGLSYAELADALDTSVPAIKSLLVRARVGLVEAGEARDTACSDIRSELARAQRRGVRASGRSRRHLRDCDACRDYRRALRAVDRGLAALQPGLPGSLSALAKLLGFGGASSGAAAGASAGGSAALVGGAGAATATATKVAAIVCCAAVVGGGAVEVREHAVPAKREHHAASATRVAPAAATTARAPAARARDPLRGHDAPIGASQRREHTVTAPRPAADGSAGDAGTSAGTVSAPAATPEEAQTGGVVAPDEPPAPDVADATPLGGDGSSAGSPSPATPAPSAESASSSAADPAADPAAPAPGPATPPTG
ncbi:MAG TPA: sigma-70 family RNA polymerase sigma factor [Solirubrobacteraceae bacterium]